MPQIVVLTTAIRHQFLEYILNAKSIGCCLDVCGYDKTNIGLTHLVEEKTDFRNIPKPDVLLKRLLIR